MFTASLDSARTALSVVECIYYDLIRREENLPQSIQKICNSVISNIENLQDFFTLLNCTSLVLVSKRCIDIAVEKFPLSILAFLNQEADFHFFLVPGLALGLFGGIVLITYNTIPQEENKEPLSILSQNLHIARLIANLALICFTPSFFKMALNLLCLGYSLWKNRQLHWIKLPLVEVSAHPQNKEMTSYQIFYRALSIEGEGKNRACSSCKKKSEGEEPFPDLVFSCSNKHIFHKACLKAALLQKAASGTPVFPYSVNPNNPNNPKKIEVTSVMNKGTEIRNWKMIFPSKALESLPTCPVSNCDGKSSMSNFEITVFDSKARRNQPVEIRFT